MLLLTSVATTGVRVGGITRGGSVLRESRTTVVVSGSIIVAIVVAAISVRVMVGRRGIGISATWSRIVITLRILWHLGRRKKLICMVSKLTSI